VKLSYLLVDSQPSPIGEKMAGDLAILHGVTRGDDEPGLPRHMNQAVREAAWGYLWTRDWLCHLQLCLLLVQARTGAQEAAEVTLRLELESILMDQLYGPPCRGHSPAPYRVLGRSR